MSYRAKLFDFALVNALGGGSAGDARCTDYLSDTIKGALLTDGWTPTTDIQFYSELTDEITETGYTAGGATLSGKSITTDVTLNVNWMKFKADTLLWGAPFSTARYLAVYNNTPTDKPLIGYVDFGHAIDGSEPDTTFEVTYNNFFGLYDTVWFSIAVDPANGLSPSGQSSWRWISRAWGNIFGGLITGQARQTDFLSDTIKVALLDSGWTPAASDQVWADISSNEITGTGYTAGGKTVTGKTVSFNAGSRLTVASFDDVEWTASDITARYAVIYNDTPTDKPLLGYLNLLADRISASGSFKIAIGTGGVLTTRVT